MSNEPLNLSTTTVSFLCTYFLLGALLGLTGNGVVLYSSVRYQAISLDKACFVLVQHLAAADLIYTVFATLPVLVAYLARKWVLGPTWCFINAHLPFIPGVANILLVLIITSHRLYVITFPFRGVFQSTKVRVWTVFIWIVSIGLFAIATFYFKSSASFNPDTGWCFSSVYVWKDAQLFMLIASVIFVVLPIMITTVANVCLSCIAFKISSVMGKTLTIPRSPTSIVFSKTSDMVSPDLNLVEKQHTRRRRRKYKGLIMTCLLSGVFVFSWLFYIVYLVAKVAIPGDYMTLYLLSTCFIMINTFVNPILYTLTNRRFGAYVKGVLLRLLKKGPDKVKHPPIKCGSVRNVFQNRNASNSNV